MARQSRLPASVKMSVADVGGVIDFLEACGYEVWIEIDIAHNRFDFVGPTQAMTLAAMQVRRICGGTMAQKSVGA